MMSMIRAYWLCRVTKQGARDQGNCNHLDTSHTTTKALSQLTEVVQTSTVG